MNPLSQAQILGWWRDVFGRFLCRSPPSFLLEGIYATLWRTIAQFRGASRHSMSKRNAPALPKGVWEFFPSPVSQTVQWGTHHALPTLDTQHTSHINVAQSRHNVLWCRLSKWIVTHRFLSTTHDPILSSVWLSLIPKIGKKCRFDTFFGRFLYSFSKLTKFYKFQHFSVLTSFAGAMQKRIKCCKYQYFLDQRCTKHCKYQCFWKQSKNIL